MHSMNPHAHAAALVRCFAGYVVKQDDPVNRENLRIASEWLRLLDSDEPLVAEIEALMKDLDALEWAGSATLDLKLGIVAWAPSARRRTILRQPCSRKVE